MVKSTIIANPVNISVAISRLSTHTWQIQPALTAFPAPTQPHPKNIVFLLDISDSMKQDGRLEKVKIAVSNLLDKLLPHDTVSIASFNDNAEILLEHRYASKAVIKRAKNIVRTLKAGSGTKFKQAFLTINQDSIIPPNSHTSIIFLTDGEDNTCTAAQLVNPFLSRQFLRIIPIGIGQQPILNEIARLGKGGQSALYITGTGADAYQHAFDTAFKLASEQSPEPTRLDMNICSAAPDHTTSLTVKRTLAPIVYAESSATSGVVHFDSPLPPEHISLCFHSENSSLSAIHRLNEEELLALNQNQPIRITIPSFKWKNNSANSWLLSFTNLLLGAGLLAGTAVFVLSFPQLSFALWQPLVIAAVGVLTGAFLLLCGLLAIARKTLFLPTKASADTTIASPQLSKTYVGFFCKTMATGALIGSGATAGYYGGTLALSLTTVIASGISPGLLIAGCTATAAIALPIFVYGCIQIGLQPLNEARSFVPR